MSYIIPDDLKSYLIRKTVCGKMLDVLSSYHAPKEILVFGCGTGGLAKLLRGWFGEARVTGYDIDELKIEKAIDKLGCDFDSQLEFTTQRPCSGQFDTAVVGHVLHHGVKKLSDEVLNYVRLGGAIGVMDYDMVGMDRDDFFKRWGVLKDEQRELKKIGYDAAYKLHTSFGLDDCVRLMHERGIRRLGYQGKIEIIGRKRDFLPNMNFYYVGSKKKNVKVIIKNIFINSFGFFF